MEDDPARASEFEDPLIGRVLQDRYRVIRVIGRGGMGVVYLAEHVLIRRKLAIKLLHSQLTASEELVHRFHREARAAAAIGNEHIVDVTDMGRLENGTYYIVLEYLDGLDLAALVAAEGPLSIFRTLNIGLQICEALTAVHNAGIVHRDLKPENIVLIDRGHKANFVKILDFGICKVANEKSLTATGVALGTPQFMAPEQLEARPEVDQRADVYAVGAILFFALSGRVPFDSESLPRLLISVWNEPPKKLREVCPDAPKALERLIARALEKHPQDRFPDSRALAAELTRISSSLGIVPTETERSWAIISGGHAGGDAAASVADSNRSQLSESSIRRVRRSRFRVTGIAFGIVALSALALAAFIYALVSSALPGPHPRRAPRTTSHEATSVRPSQPEMQLAPDVGRQIPSDPEPSGTTSPTSETSNEVIEPQGPRPASPPKAHTRRRHANDTSSDSNRLPRPTTAAPVPNPDDGRDSKSTETETETETETKPRQADERTSGADGTSPLVPSPAELKRVF